MNLDRLEEIAKKATPGPWTLSTEYGDEGGKYLAIHNERYEYAIGEFGPSLSDAEYIVAMSNMVPKLIKVARAAQQASVGLEVGEPISADLYFGLKDALKELES